PLDVDAMRALAADVPDAHLVLRAFEADGGVSLVRTDLIGHARHGGEVSWALWSVAVTTGGRFTRFELFEIDDESAARARCAELASKQAPDGRGAPSLGNRGGGKAARFARAFGGGDLDAVAAFVGPEARYLARRHGPTSPPALGREGVMDHTRAVADV